MQKFISLTAVLSVFLFLILIILFALIFSACGGPFLVKNGQTDFTIVLPDAPQPVEQTAAKELKTYLDEITGTDWIIASEKDVPEDAPQILVGYSTRTKKFFPEIDPEKIPYDGIEIHLKGNKLLLTGHQQRGTLYAVNTFLEDVLGVRWWTSTEQTVPVCKTFKLKPLNISYAPKLILRQTNYQGAGADDPVFATRMKCNGNKAPIEPEYGGHHQILYWGHSFFELIPPQKYFADHPEWFSEIDGIRQHRLAQLCLTNDEMRQELTKNAISALRNHPDAKFIAITQEDHYGYCTCEKCKQLDDAEGSPSGALIHFVNAVAEDIEKEFPEVFVLTLAYEYTLQPPKHIKPRENVIMQLTTIECSFVQPITGEQNQSKAEVIKDWRKITNQFFVWDYVTNYLASILPHPNLRVLAPNIRFFADHGAIALYEEADLNCAEGDFVRMRNWLISKLMWNPALDEKKLIREFLEGYYGEKATPFLLEYFDTLIDKAESSGKFIGCFMENTEDWLDYETLCRATALFDKAIAAAEQENGEFTERLRRERLPLEHAWLKGYNKFKWIAEKKEEKFCGPPDPVEAFHHFFAMLDKYRTTALSDKNQSPATIANYKENMYLRLTNPTPAPIPEEFRNYDPNMLMDIQEYDFIIMYAFGRNRTVDDPAASNGRAMLMQGFHNYRLRTIANTEIFKNWFVRIWHEKIDVVAPINTCHPLFENTDADSKFKVVVYLRCDATAKDGHMTCGIQTQEGKNVATRCFDAADIAGSEYQKIEFEPVSLSQSMFIWFTPLKKDEERQNVYIDRVMIIREN